MKDAETTHLDAAEEACGIAPGLATGQVDGTVTVGDLDLVRQKQEAYLNQALGAGIGNVPADHACCTEAKMLDPEAEKRWRAAQREIQRHDPWFRQQVMQLALGSFAGERAKTDELVAAATKILDWVVPPEAE